VAGAARWDSRTSGLLETLLLAALVYWILTIVLSILQDRLEKRMAESDRRSEEDPR
jgi:ABC-type amino acid transport system permease subunit